MVPKVKAFIWSLPTVHTKAYIFTLESTLDSLASPKMAVVKIDESIEK